VGKRENRATQQQDQENHSLGFKKKALLFPHDLRPNPEPWML
jgi:hypothetical protein